MAVLLPPHWQTAAVLMGAWSAGIAVSFRLAATAGLPALGTNEDEPFDAVFVARNRVDDWLDHVPQARHRFVLGLAPDAAPLAEVPDGYRDLIAELARTRAPCRRTRRCGRPTRRASTGPATASGERWRRASPRPGVSTPATGY